MWKGLLWVHSPISVCYNELRNKQTLLFDRRSVTILAALAVTEVSLSFDWNFPPIMSSHTIFYIVFSSEVMSVVLIATAAIQCSTHTPSPNISARWSIRLKNVIKYLEDYCKSWDQILCAQLYCPFHFFGDFSDQFSFFRRGIWGKHFWVMITLCACRNKINHRGLKHMF